MRVMLLVQKPGDELKYCHQAISEWVNAENDVEIVYCQSSYRTRQLAEWYTSQHGWNSYAWSLFLGDHPLLLQLPKLISRLGDRVDDFDPDLICCPGFSYNPAIWLAASLMPVVKLWWARRDKGHTVRLTQEQLTRKQSHWDTIYAPTLGDFTATNTEHFRR